MELSLEWEFMPWNVMFQKVIQCLSLHQQFKRRLKLKAKNEKLGWEEKFEGLMMIAIDEGLKSIAGEASTKVIYYQLEKIFQTGMNELIKNLKN